MVFCLNAQRVLKKIGFYMHVFRLSFDVSHVERNKQTGRNSSAGMRIDNRDYGITQLN